MSKYARFKCTRGHGFQMVFKNGLTASVQWGSENCCDNWNDSRTADFDAVCADAEIAVWETDTNKMLRASDFLGTGPYDDDVVGYCSPEQVADFLEAVKRHLPVNGW